MKIEISAQVNQPSSVDSGLCTPPSAADCVDRAAADAALAAMISVDHSHVETLPPNQA